MHSFFGLSMIQVMSGCHSVSKCDYTVCLSVFKFELENKKVSKERRA